MGKTWEDVPADIKTTFDRLGVPQAEREYLAGVKAQYDSEVVYGSLKKELEEKGIIFLGTDEALKKYPEYLEKYFGTIVSAADNKFAALNTAVWSGGSFIYIPKGVKIDKPLQAYFRINASHMGQFERTLIIAEDDSFAHYVEGCSAPVYSDSSLHSAVVEIIVKKGARFRYTTIQNWYQNVYNLVTKRAFAYENSTMEWVDANIGSKVTMKYPATILEGDNSKGLLLSLALAQKSQEIDSGGKMIHIGKNTKSLINSKTVSKQDGIGVYRGTVKISKNAKKSKSLISCEGLILDKDAKSFAFPIDEINNMTSTIEHEAKVSKLSQDQLNYLMSRGLTEQEASYNIISGFVKPVTNDLPMEYTVELDKILDMFVK